MDKVKNVIGYCRVSTSKQEERRNGLEGQIAEIKRFAEHHGLNLIAIREEAVSGKHGLDRRHVLRKALQDAESMKNCVVLVSKLDRLSRSASFILNMMEQSKKFLVAELGFDVRDLNIHIHAVFAEDERKRISERTKAGLAQTKRLKGTKLGMHNPKVYAANFKATVNAAKAVKTDADAFAAHIKPVIARMRQVGMSVNDIAAELNQQGNKTARGGKWYPTTICNVMKRVGIK